MTYGPAAVTEGKGKSHDKPSNHNLTVNPCPVHYQ